MSSNDEVLALKRAVAEQCGAAIAAAKFGQPSFGPIIAQHLKVDVEDGKVHASVVDTDGRKRTTFDSATGKFRAVTAEELAGELIKKHPQLRAQESDVKGPPRQAGYAGYADGQASR